MPHPCRKKNLWNAFVRSTADLDTVRGVQEAFEGAYRKLRAQLIIDGFFNASLAWYAYKMMSQVLA